MFSYIKELFMNQEDKDFLHRQRLYRICLELDTWFKGSTVSSARQVKILKKAVVFVVHLPQQIIIRQENIIAKNILNNYIDTVRYLKRRPNMFYTIIM